MPRTIKTEHEFESVLIKLLVTQLGWSGGILNYPTEEILIKNWASILFKMNRGQDRLNDVPLNKAEMNQLIRQVSSLGSPLLKNDFINGGSVSIKRENPEDKLHFGKEVSLKLFNRKEIAGGDSNYQIALQPIFSAHDKIKGDRRGDFTFLINGMPVIHVELKRSGVPIRHAVNQIQRYIHNGAFSTGIFSLIQVFVAMTPEDLRYFANPGTDPRSIIDQNYVFHWADFDNNPITDWRTNAHTLLSIPMAHQLISYYTVADKADDTLKVLRSYQIYAVKEIFDRIEQINWHERQELGGYIWHTTGSGKTLTSFKAAELVASYGIAEKVVFLTDRINLGTQTLKEFRGFADFEDYIQETESTDILLDKLKSDDSDMSLIVTSIQKMSRINADITGKSDLDKVRLKKLIIVIDEAHRSTFGEMLLTIKHTFPNAIFFGFTGTPIHEENKRKDSTTATIFGNELHRYSLYDGICDGNVLGFDVTKLETFDYEELRQQIALSEAHAKTVEDVYSDSAKAVVFEKFMDHKEVPLATYEDEEGRWIKGIEEYISSAQYEEEHRDVVVTDIYKHWLTLSKNGKYSALLAVPSIREAIEYYRLLKDNPLGIKVTALFDSNLDESGGSIHKEDGLAEVLLDYNTMFNKRYTLANYAQFKQDITLRLAHKGVYRNLPKNDQIDIVVVVNQLLTGYDSKWLNTLYLDKTLEYANVIQAFSRTNRLNGSDKPFGSIRYYRKVHTMEQNIKKAVKLYSGDKEYGLFVDKLGSNLCKMNDITQDIIAVFAADKIEYFTSLPEAPEARRKYANLFQQFEHHLEASLIQGFLWDRDTYMVEVPDANGVGEMRLEEIEVIFTKTMYDSWLQRYRELANKASSDDIEDSIPYDIDYNLVQKAQGRIDFDYLNNHFNKYLRLKEQEINPAKQLKVKNDLHRYFATLSSKQQIYANMVINDLENGELMIDEGKQFTDYINDYQARSESNQINSIVRAFGVDEEQLRNMIDLQITENNINEFGRFSSLMGSISQQQAALYLCDGLGKELKPYEVNRYADRILRDFIYSGGFNIDDYLEGKLKESNEL